MFQLQEIKGLESLSVLNVYQSLLIGLKMMPAYASVDDEVFLDTIEKMDKADQERVFWDAAKIVPLEKYEVERLLKFYKDKNGVPISKENINALGPMDIAEMVVTVCMKVSEIKVDFVTESEKKKSMTSQ